ncbi:MAG: hypothetical protein H6732_11535 [Alphaproteobacteria bacterium]|nr:hypothetical protein [Alphaproteobacteria bacterium]
MEQEQYTALAKSLKRARKTTRPFFWWFCVKGPDGKPVVLVGRKEADVKAGAKAARKTAQDKRFGRGRALPDPKANLVLSLDAGTAKPKQIARSFRMDLAKDPGLKRVKGLIQKARVVLPEDFASIFGAVEADDTAALDETALAKKVEKAKKAAKEAYQAARERVGTDHPDFAEVESLKKEAFGAKGDLAEQLDLFEQLLVAAKGAGEDDEGEDVEITFDVAAAHQAWLDAMDTVDGQLNALASALRKEGTDEAMEVADTGLNALTGNYKVKIQGALLEAKLAKAGEAQTAALRKAADLAEDLLELVRTDERYEAVDENPWGVKCTLRKTLGTVLETLTDAI